MIGTEDRILNTWAQFVKKYSFLPLIGDGSTKYVYHVIQTLPLLFLTILCMSLLFIDSFFVNSFLVIL